jgi:hypothetical protein
MPVPGMEAVPYNPFGPRLTVNGAPPILALKPVFDRFSLSPGSILKDCRNRQVISSPSVAFDHWPINITVAFFSNDNFLPASADHFGRSVAFHSFCKPNERNQIGQWFHLELAESCRVFLFS